jgi:hypothetical protein
MAETIAGEWFEQGVKRGEERGEERGLRAMRRVLKSQLEARFGPMPASLVQQWEACTDPDWFEKALMQTWTAKQPEELTPPQPGT